MSVVGADAELVSLRRSFRIGMVAVAAFLVAVGGVVAAFGSSADRPAGIAERWLVALSDTTRDGLEEDAVERMEEHQTADVPSADPLSLFPSLGDDRQAADDGEARFETIRVGRAVDGGLGDDVALVPFEITAYQIDEPVDGYVVVVDTDDGWKVRYFGSVTAIEGVGGFRGVCQNDRCRGFPIERPERAPFGFWIGTLALGVLIAAACSLAARAATPRSPVTGARAAS